MKKSRSTASIKEDASLPSGDRFLARYKNFADYYVTLLCFVGVSVAIATVIALFSNVLLGLALAVLSAVVYTVCETDEAKKQLGITCSHITGRIHIKTAIAEYGEELVIPKRFEFADVTHICDRAFADEKNGEVSAVLLPDSITYIGSDIFGDRGTLPEIRFEGTEEQWSAIEKHTDLSRASVTFCASHPIPPKKPKRNGKTHQSAEIGGETE